ncbi:MAG: hypothetical protein H6943_10450 [Zoogloeaceae bacterium]|nr:hypothetical protein [Zoogloeaceae bacterium]
MNDTPLITSWTEYAQVAARLLAQAEHSISIFDADLSALRLEQPETSAALTRFFRSTPSTLVRISIRNPAPLRNSHPRLLELLRLFSHKLEIRETPAQLSNLSDSILLVDNTSALIRFHNDHPRSKEIIASSELCRPYQKRFEDIWSEGGNQIFATVTGL